MFEVKQHFTGVVIIAYLKVILFCLAVACPRWSSSKGIGEDDLHTEGGSWFLSPPQVEELESVGNGRDHPWQTCQLCR